jgi:hypothetical protein
MPGPVPDKSTVDLRGGLPFPDPVAVLSLRRTKVYRAVDDDGQPLLIISDGVTAVALDSGLGGLSEDIVHAAEELAEASLDYANSLRAAWRPAGGA